MSKSKIGNSEIAERINTINEQAVNDAKEAQIVEQAKERAKRTNRTIAVYVVKVTEAQYTIAVTSGRKVVCFYFYNVKRQESEKGIITERSAESMRKDIYARNSDYRNVFSLEGQEDKKLSCFFQAFKDESFNDMLCVAAMSYIDLENSQDGCKLVAIEAEHNEQTTVTE